MNHSAARPIDRFIRRLEKEQVNLHGFLLSVNGRETAGGYAPPFMEGQPHRLYSISKTFTGIAVGMLMDDGLLSLDDRIADYFRGWLPENPDGQLLRLTIRDMLRMATCYCQTAYREGVDDNWAKAFFTGAPTHEPGAVFHYDTGCSQVLGALVRRLSGLEVMDFLEERLFTPLGMEDRRFWLRDPSGCCRGGSGLCMSLRDLHRASLCLQDGGRGLIPAWYVEQMSRRQIETPLQTNEEERYGYGWQCWRTRAGWAMYGMGGQLAVFCPEKKALLCTIADTRLDPFGVQRIYNAFFEELYPFLETMDGPAERFSLRLPSVSNTSAFAFPEAGPYEFPAGNPLSLREMTLTADGLVYENARGRVSLPLTMGGLREIPFPGWPEEAAVAAAGWIGENLLLARCHAIGEAPCGFEMLLSFSEERLTVQARRSKDPLTEGYEGTASGMRRRA